MTPRGYSNRIKALFSEAVELPADRVGDFLDSRCEAGDDDRAQVEALLRAHGRAGQFLDPANDSKVLPSIPSVTNRVRWLGVGEQPGSFVDRYQLVAILGEGGFGVVYRAEQVRPVRRTVALKVIKSGTDSDAVLARFEVERQALASMDHANIAGLIDAGTTENGRPYFVMELVDGPPITVHVKSTRLSAAGILNLYIPVCQAVHHAHQKGILHRDIKPSNILVDAVSGTAKVIDFGIAKPIGGSGAGPVTEIGQRIGTPRYMSPEQAAGNGVILDTRSDVFSLGAVLTEMLTGAGQTPVPSKALPRELRWIVRKATDVEPLRRYGSAAALGEDLRNYLDGRPLTAGPPGISYLARKFIGRHKVGAALATAAVLALVASLVALSVALVRVRASRDGILLAEKGRRTAERQAIDKLRESLLMQARAGRRSGLPGQRLDSIAAITEAVKILPGPDLRDELIACLATPDVRFDRAWTDEPGWTIGPLTPSKDRYAEYDESGNFRIVRATDGKVVCAFPRQSRAEPLSIEFSRDGAYLALVYMDPKVGVALWDATTGRCVLRLPGPGRSKSFGGDGRSIVIDNDAGDLIAYDLKTGQPLVTRHTGSPITRICCQAGTDAVAVFKQGVGLSIVHLSGAAPPKKIATSIDGVMGLAWSPDGRRLAVGGAVPNLIEIFDSVSGSLQKQLQGHLLAVTQVGFTDQGRLVVSASWDGTVRVWDTATGKMLITCPSNGFFPEPDADDSIFLQSTGNRIERWQLISGSACVSYAGLVKDDFFESAAFSPDNRVLVATNSNGLCAWSTETGLPIGYLAIPTARTPMFVKGGTRILVSIAGGVRDLPAEAVESGDGPHGVGHDRLLTAALATDADCKTLLCSDPDGTVWTAPVENPAAKTVIGKASGAPRFMALSPDGRWALSTCRRDEDAIAWDVTNHAIKARLRRSAEVAEIGSVGFSADGHTAVTADQTAYYFWRVPEWTLVRKLDRGHASTPGLLAFSRDGQLLAVTGPDQTLQLLDPRTGARLATLDTPTPHGAAQLRFSDDGSKLALCAFGGVLVWDIRQIRSELAAAGLGW